MNDIDDLRLLIELIKKEFPSDECCGKQRQKDVIEEVIKLYAGRTEEDKEPWRG